jgi:hypothetical protein
VSTGRRTDIVRRPRTHSEHPQGELVQRATFADGSPWFEVRVNDAGYLFCIRNYGRYLVSPDGHDITCLGASSVEQRDRFVASHGLPAAAVLQGYEVLHASAVARAGAAIAFVGLSGLGKTTIACELVVRGADLVADDALVLEPCDGRPLAHAGLPFMAVRQEDLAVRSSGRERLGTSLGVSDKAHVSPPRSHEALPLQVMYHLVNSDRVKIESLQSGGQRLLGAAFLPFIASPDRLRTSLLTAELLHSNVKQFTISSPRGRVDERFIDLVDQHLRAEGL